VQVLSRPYRVAEITWGPGVPATTILDFPKILLDVPALSKRLTTFKFLRAGVKLSIKMNTTQFHYGAYMISWLPFHTGTTHAQDAYQQSGNRPIILSASLQNTCEIRIPWVNPYNYCSAQTGTTQIGRVWFTPLTPLGTANPNVTDTVMIQVFANFEDIETAGYIAEAQSKAGAAIDEVVDKSRFAIETVGRTVDSVQSMLDKVPIIGDLVGMFETAISMFDKPTSIQAMQPIEVDFSRDFNRGDGMDHCHALSLTNLSPVSLDPTLTGEQMYEKSILSIAQVPMLTRIFTFNGPIPTIPFNVSCNPFGHTDAYLVPGMPTKPDYFEFVARHFMFWRSSIKYMIYFYTSQFTSGRFRVSILYDGTLPTDHTSGDIVSEIIDVRGDTNYQITVPYLWPTMYRTLINSVGVSYPKLVIQQLAPLVGASMEEDPVVYCCIFRSAAEDVRFNQLVDFQTVGLPPPALLANEPKRKRKIANADMDIRGEFAKVFPPIAHGSSFVRENGTVSGEMISSISDLLKRYVTTPPIYGTGDTANVLNTWPQPTQLGPYHSFSRIFKYWRGARRVKFLYDLDAQGANRFNYVCMETFLNPVSAGNSMSYTHGELWPQQCVEIPWYSTLPFQPSDTGAVPTFLSDDSPKSIVIPSKSVFAGIYSSGGDDFSYYFLIAPEIYG